MYLLPSLWRPVETWFNRPIGTNTNHTGPYLPPPSMMLVLFCIRGTNVQCPTEGSLDLFAFLDEQNGLWSDPFATSLMHRIQASQSSQSTQCANFQFYSTSSCSRPEIGFVPYAETIPGIAGVDIMNAPNKMCRNRQHISIHLCDNLLIPSSVLISIDCPRIPRIVIIGKSMCSWCALPKQIIRRIILKDQRLNGLNGWTEWFIWTRKLQEPLMWLGLCRMNHQIQLFCFAECLRSVWKGAWSNLNSPWVCQGNPKTK